MSPPVRQPVGFFRATAILLRKDLLLEWRTRARVNALVFFALATLLLFAFALDANRNIMQAAAGGLLWLGLLFSSVLALGESFRVENENAALDGIRLVPASGRAIFIAKALGNTLLIYALGWLLLPVMVALYDIHLTLGPGPYAIALLLGCLSITAPGVVFSAIANNARARDVLLPLLLFPLLVPALLASVKATTLVFGGDPMDQLRSWLWLVAGFDVIYWALGFLLFPRVIED
ncbi:MAG: heme exporter protein CcmB [Myxococcaceae bacterium]|nr:heme exporter protein CcmB [Myxococcaceae bacterium]